MEAVTGAGKTRLALAAIAEEIHRGGRAAVIVPTNDLQRQWIEEIHSSTARRITDAGFAGGDGRRLRSGLTRTSDVLVATVQSASRYDLGLAAHRGLLIADEVHHMGAEQWSAALEPGFDRRLGLTATYERDDDGIRILDNYFGAYRYRLGYREALDDFVIAHFKVAFIAVSSWRPR